MNVKAYVAEFIGTFALIFIGIGVITHLGTAQTGLTGIALGHGFAIACLVSATMAVSGGHLNPAVTLGLLVGKKIDALNAVGYIISQIVGAYVAALCAQYVLPGQSITNVIHGTPALAMGTLPAQGFVAEAIATFFLIFVVYGSAVDRRAHKVGGLFIGLTIAMGILAIGPLTGAAINPARWLGPALLTHGFDNWWVWILGPICGGIVAGLVYTGILEERAPAAEQPA